MTHGIFLAEHGSVPEHKQASREGGARFEVDAYSCWCKRMYEWKAQLERMYHWKAQ
jgi:hypothetical protein